MSGDYTAAAITQRSLAAALRCTLNAKIILIAVMGRLGKRTAEMKELGHLLDAEIAGALATNHEATSALDARRAVALARLRRRDR